MITLSDKLRMYDREAADGETHSPKVSTTTLSGVHEWRNRIDGCHQCRVVGRGGGKRRGVT